MINEPPVDVLTDKIGEKYNGSKYALCVVSAMGMALVVKKKDNY